MVLNGVVNYFSKRKEGKLHALFSSFSSFFFPEAASGEREKNKQNWTFTSGKYRRLTAETVGDGLGWGMGNINVGYFWGGGGGEGGMGLKLDRQPLPLAVK